MPQDGERTVSARNRDQKLRQRAAIACQYCNIKRIKCNAPAGLPCSSCKQSGRDCQLIESRRGQRRVNRSSITDPQDSPVQKDHRHTASDEQQLPINPRALLDTENVTENVTVHVQGQANLPEALRTQGNVQPNTLELTDFLSPNRHGESSSEVDYGAVLEEKKQELHMLAMQHAFDVPNSDLCLQLFRVFFLHVAPSYPIIDRANFIFQFAIPQRPPSWLLLQAVLFTATAHCKEHLLKDAGFGSRGKARMTFFNRAKVLYDADHEKDKFTVVQATFLMSLWWKSPDDSKDNWHWLQLSINLALSLGMHRSSKDSGMPLKTQRLWKKLWWSLYTEDKYLAATLSRPARLRSSECNVEPLEMADFSEEPYGFGDSFRVGLPKVIMAYPICLSNLAKITERVIEQSSQDLGPKDFSPELCDGILQVWEVGLPQLLKVKQNESTDLIWPNMIQITAWYVIES